MKSIILGGGCFWCLEAVFQRVRGVQKVTSGYSGGHVDNPDYKSVCHGETGHAEVVQVEYDESVIKLEELLEIFFTIHDPTTLNRQGNDVGTQYRSVVFYNDDDEKDKVQQFIDSKADEFKDPIVTQVESCVQFWPAESYHNDYYNNNRAQPYCQVVVGTKVAKLKQFFANYVNE